MADKVKEKEAAKTPAKAGAAKKPEGKKRRSPIKVVKDSVSEMKKVTWPSRKDWINHTVIVMVFCVIMMAVVGLIDTGLSALFGAIFS